MSKEAKLERIVASAPGKIVLSGEYAVLDGAPAIAMAVDRRALVTLSRVPGHYGEVSASGHSEDVGRFDVRETPLRWVDNAAPYSLLDAVWNQLPTAPESGVRLQLNTQTFSDSLSSTKLGLGSSAALCVALTAALQNSAPQMQHAFKAHHDFQGGRGSGVDVACSINGGLLQYQMQGRSTLALEWPKHLSYRVLWTGIAADTRSKLARLQHSSIEHASRQTLRRSSQDLAECWRSADAQSIISAYRGYCRKLQQFDSDHVLGIFDAGHAEMYALANAADLVYKPCGAGGGDIGILLSTDEHALDCFVDSNAGSFKSLKCKLDTRGVTMEQCASG